MSKLVEDIHQALTGHGHVSFEYSHDKNKEPNALKRYYMTHAHNAAYFAAGGNLFNAVDLPDPYATDLNPKDVKPRNKPKQDQTSIRHDSSNAMDIIDLGNEDDDITLRISFKIINKNAGTLSRFFLHRFWLGR